MMLTSGSADRMWQPGMKAVFWRLIPAQCVASLGHRMAPPWPAAPLTKRWGYGKWPPAEASHTGSHLQEGWNLAWSPDGSTLASGHADVADGDGNSLIDLAYK